MQLIEIYTQITISPEGSLPAGDMENARICLTVLRLSLLLKLANQEI
jgi:hypothetical protein